MSETPSSTGCLTPIFMLLAAILGSFMAAFNTASSVFVAPPEIVTTISIAPIGIFAADELHQTAAVLQKRLTGMGLSTATVDVSGDTSIQVGLPQVEQLDDVLKTLTARGLLEFVDFTEISDFNAWKGREIITSGQGDHPISDKGLDNPETNQPFETILTGDGIQSATSEISRQNGVYWEVLVVFSDEASKILGDYTRAHIGKPLAIVVDGKVLSIPVIQAEITTQAIIVGNFTEQVANRLAVQIGSGALPFELQVRFIRGDSGISVSTATPASNP